MSATTESAWQWIVANKETLWEILRHIPLREIAASVTIGVLIGLLIGAALCAVLQKTGLLTRKTKWLNIAVKIYWPLIPALLAFAGVQVALVRCAWHTADGIVVANETTIRKYTGEFLGQVQAHLDAAIEQSPSLKNASLNTLIDAAIEQTFAEPAPSTKPSETAAPSTTEKVTGWLMQTARSAYLRVAIKKALTKTAQKVSGADKTTVEMAFDKTLGEMTETNIVYDFARERLRRFMWSLIGAVLLHTLPFLLIPVAEISLSKWRKW